MTKLAPFAVIVAAVALAIAAVSYQVLKSPDSSQTDVNDILRLNHEMESLSRIEQIATDLQNQAENTAKVLSQLNVRLSKIERAHQDVAEKLSADIDAVSLRLDQIAPMRDDEIIGDQQEPASAMDRLKARYQAATGKALDNSVVYPESGRQQKMVDRFYEHGEYDEASREREAIISQSFPSNSEALDILGVECRNAICKVDYQPKLSGPEREMAEFNLINAITTSMGSQVSIVTESYGDGTGSFFIE